MRRAYYLSQRTTETTGESIFKIKKGTILSLITRSLNGCLLNNIYLTCGQHSVYVCHRSNIPWLHHTNCIKVYEANRCTFRLLRTIPGQMPALKA